MHDKSVRRHSAGRTRWAHPAPSPTQYPSSGRSNLYGRVPPPPGPLASSCASPQLPRHDVFPFPFPSPAVLNVIRFFPRRANFRRCPTTPPPPRNSRAEASCVPAAAPLAPGASFPFERCPLSHSRCCNVRVAHKEVIASCLLCWYRSGVEIGVTNNTLLGRGIITATSSGIPQTELCFCSRWKISTRRVFIVCAAFAYRKSPIMIKTVSENSYEIKEASWKIL